VSELAGGRVCVHMQRDILVDIRTSYMRYLSRTLHSRSRDAVCRVLGLDIAFAVWTRVCSSDAATGMSVSSLIAAAACAVRGRV
jgi:hypothetical protein